MDWLAEVSKAITFPAPGVGMPDAGALWTKISGAEPENVNRRGLPAPNLSAASGLWNELTLNVVIQAGRIETSLTMVDLDPGGPAPIPFVPADRVDAILDLMQEVANKVQEGLSCVRFGAAVQLVQPAVDVKSGVELLNSRLNNVFPAAADSPLFQINVRKPLVSVPSGYINRLCKWGVAGIRDMVVAVDQAGNVVPTTTGDERFLSFFHIDVNNPKLDAGVQGKEARALIGELWKETRALAQGGFDVLT